MQAHEQVQTENLQQGETEMLEFQEQPGDHRIHEYSGATAVQLSGCRHLRHARQVLRATMPNLLRRAVERSASVVSDDCHLHAVHRAALRSALVKYSGRVRWIVVLPRTAAELRERRQSRKEAHSALDELTDAELPGSGRDGVQPEFVEGDDLSVFDEWRWGKGSEEASPSRQRRLARKKFGQQKRLSRRSGGSSVIHRFFRKYGGSKRFLSTEGARVL